MEDESRPDFLPPEMPQNPTEPPGEIRVAEKATQAAISPILGKRNRWIWLVVILLAGTLVAGSALVRDLWGSPPPSGSTTTTTTNTGVAPTDIVLPCLGGSKIWLLTVCGSGTEMFMDVAVGKDGSVHAVGYSNSVDGDFSEIGGESETNGMVVRFFSGGKWTLETTPFENYNAIISAPDGNLIVVGAILTHQIDPVYGWDALITKWSPSGEEIWQASMDPSGHYDGFLDAAVTSSGDVVALGTSMDSESIMSLFIGYFSSSGKPLWQRDLGVLREYGGVPEDITVTPDGSIYIVGSGSGIEDQNNAFVSKYTKDGIQEWIKYYGTDGDGFMAVTPAKEGIIVVGRFTAPEISSYIPGGALVNINQQGDIGWSQTYRTEGVVDFTDVATTDDHILAVGTLYSPSVDTDALVVQFDTEGKFLWDRVFGGSMGDGFYGVASTKNGDILAVGRTTSIDGNLPPAIGSDDALIVRLTSKGDVVSR